MHRKSFLTLSAISADWRGFPPLRSRLSAVFGRDARSLRPYRRTARHAAFCPAPQPCAHSAQGCRHGGQRRVELDQAARRAFPRARGNEICSGQRCKKSLAASQIILATAPCRRYYEQDLISTDADCQIVNGVRINRKTIRFGGRASSLIVMTLGIYKGKHPSIFFCRFKHMMSL